MKFPMSVVYVDADGDWWESDDVPHTAVIETIVGLPSIDRDTFLADLARECALLGVEWPPSCKDATSVIRRSGVRMDQAGE